MNLVKGVLAAVVLSIFGASALAMTISDSDIPGKYNSNGEQQKTKIKLEMKADKTFAASVVDQKATKPKTKTLNGTWLIKDNTLLMTSGKDVCALHYKADLIFSGGAEVGYGLECADAKANKKPDFCFCLFEKEEAPAPTPTPKK